MKFDEVITIDPGHHVVCDICNEDFTDSDVSGGFLFGSNAVCPNCADAFLEDVRKYNEEWAIRGRCPPDKSFADWVREDLRCCIK